MNYNYKNISDSMKISIMAMEGYISMNRLKNTYDDNFKLEIIYNKKYISEKEYSKTDEILKLERIINIIVSYQLKNNKSLDEINKFINKVSAENIEEVRY